jgi:hypothetical protein
MNTKSDDTLEIARRAALDVYDAVDRNTKFMVGLAGIAEVGLGVTLIWLTNFSEPLHLLIFVATATVYVPLSFCICAIASHAERNSKQILKALELNRKLIIEELSDRSVSDESE